MARVQENGPENPHEIRLEIANEAALARLAARLAMAARPGDLICLEGDLGAGKTSFARAFIHALQDDPEEVPSPTFTLLQSYETRAGLVHHFDLYRIADAAEAGPLGFEDALGEGIVLVEWPERLGPLLLRERLSLRLEFGPTPDSRRAILRGFGERAERLRNIAVDG
ncbi:MAG: tRNA (adenosine(37)-N6)-threonylcarbamoyltransferase complex ATPase subunit type 1 TsaE [Dongiaceae bacterium]